jgi:signal transduction histidine kinase
MPESILYPTSIKHLIDNWIAHNGDRYISRKIKLINNISSSLPMIDIDERHFGFLLQCACNNSLQAINKDRSDGMISFDAEINNDDILLRITDNGVGMDEATKEKILIKSHTTKSDGTGLGIRIIKKVCDNHNAELDIISNINIGTSIIVKFKRKVINHEKTKDTNS